MQLSWSRVRLRARIAGPLFLGGFSMLYAASQPGLKTRPPHTSSDVGPASLDVGPGSSDPGRQATPAARPNDERWWKREPIRFLQTNLSETRLDRRPDGARRRGRRLRRQHVPDEHGRHRRAVSDAGAVPLSERVPAARPRSVRRRAPRGARAKDPRHRPLRSEQDAEGRCSTRIRNGSSGARTASR